MGKEALWAKTSPQGEETWLSLEQHLQDSFLMAGHLWDSFLPHHVKQLLLAYLPSEAVARSYLQLLCGLHDIGKATTFFQQQAWRQPALLDALEEAGLPYGIGPYKAQEVRHELSGLIYLEQALQAEAAFTPEAASSFAAVVGGHHGAFAKTAVRLDAASKFSDYDGAQWKAARGAVLREVLTWLPPEHLQSLDSVVLPPPLQLLLTGFVIQVDWLASSTKAMPLLPTGHEAVEAQEARCEQGWKTHGLPPRWRLAAPAASFEDGFRQDFALPATATPRPLQYLCREVAEASSTPGLYILEAPMGVGKTEAALVLSRGLMERHGFDGLLFALPTMATTDALYGRLSQWLTRVTAEGATINLLHSKATLNPAYSALSQAAASPSAACGLPGTVPLATHSWFAKKSALLAPVVVSTIDQLLLAALRVKHGALRQAGLAGKVVVVDEVHAADSYMLVFLTSSLAWLAFFGTPVILLSATLPGATRLALVEAYRQGQELGRQAREAAQSKGSAGVKSSATAQARPQGSGRPRGAKAAPPLLSESLRQELSSSVVYPAVTVVEEEVKRLAPAETLKQQEVTVSFLEGPGQEEVAALLKQQLAAGGCAVVIKNSVKAAQELAVLLMESFPGEVSLLHSRYTGHDRMALEQALREHFGPQATVENGLRPKRAIVVATQVVEQSLDVDFDFMVSDLAPADLLLQRMGRLHRHGRTGRPPRLAQPRFVISSYGHKKDDTLAFDFAGRMIYGEFKLRAALEAFLQVPQGQLQLPGSISPLVARAYDESLARFPLEEQAATFKALQEQQAEVAKFTALAQEWALPRPGDPTFTGVQALYPALGEAKGEASVRFGSEGLTVIPVRQMLLPSGDFGYQALSKSADRPQVASFTEEGSVSTATAKELLASQLSLPMVFTNPYKRLEKSISELEENCFPSWQRSSWLEGELPLVFTATSEGLWEAHLLDRRLTYDSVRGLREEKVND